MSDPAGERFGLEQPEADVLDQRREEAPPRDPELEPLDEMPAEADEADALDQRRVVPVDDGES